MKPTSGLMPQMKNLRVLTKITETVFIDSVDHNEIEEVARIIDAEAQASSLKIKETHSEIQWAVEEDGDELLPPPTIITEVSFSDAVDTLISSYWGNFEDMENLKQIRQEMKQAADRFEQIMEKLDGQEDTT